MEPVNQITVRIFLNKLDASLEYGQSGRVTVKFAEVYNIRDWNNYPFICSKVYMLYIDGIAYLNWTFVRVNHNLSET